MTNQEFLPKDPTKALVEVKEKLYARLTMNRGYIDKNRKFLKTLYPDEEFTKCEIRAETRCFEEETRFLENLIDMIERS